MRIEEPLIVWHAKLVGQVQHAQHALISALLILVRAIGAVRALALIGWWC